VYDYALDKIVYTIPGMRTQIGGFCTGTQA